MLDISIKSIEKVINKEEKLNKLINSEVEIEAKYDGIKVTVIKIANNGDISDWIFSYKGNILTKNEFNYNNKNEIIKYSIGSSQFRLFIDYFRNIKSNNIPINTEFLIEFLMNKPTLCSDYLISHKLILIAYSKSEIKVKNGILISNPNKFQIEKRDEYAKLLNIKTPKVLFKGKLINKFKNIDDIKNYFLKIPSEFGGIDEGIIIRSKEFELLKIKNNYSKETRIKIKNKYRGNKEYEENYWKNIRIISLEIVNKIILIKDLESSLSELSERIEKYNINIKHIKKNIINIKDDIQLTAKKIIISKLPENNNSLIIGKFKPFHKGHQVIIDKALRETDTVYINIVKKDFISEKLIREIYGNKVKIIYSFSGNIITIINKIQDNINIIYSGSDRVETYKRQIKNNKDLKIIEIKRNNISGTLIRKAIKEDNIIIFKKYMDKKVWKFYQDLRTLIL